MASKYNNEVTNAERETLLKWFETLETNTLRKAWRFILSIPRESQKQQRRRQIENEVMAFVLSHPNASDEDWYRFARWLKEVGYYSKTTAISDITDRLRKIK